MAERSRPDTSPPPESAGPFASSWRRRHLTVDERNARGLAARQEAPRSSHERDYAALAAAVDSGRLTARTGV